MDKARLFEFIERQQREYPLEKSIGRKEGDGWKFYSTEEIIDQSYALAGGLLAMGIKPGDKIAMASYKNRPEWNITDLATLMIGVINVPLYPTISPGEYAYILNEAEVKMAFVGADDLYDKVAEAQKTTASLESIYTYDIQEGRPHWESIFDRSHKEEIDRLKETIGVDDLATIIYTSGTTGNPKGVMLTHGNISSVIIDTAKLLPVTKGEKVLSFLPYCHVFERAISFCYMYHSVTVYCTGTDNLGGPSGDLATVKPHFFSTVPRLLEKVYEKIFNKGLELSGTKKKLFFWALSLTDDFEHDQKLGGIKGLKNKIADKLIYSKWREALGGNVRAIVTGAAPCPSKIIRVFSAAGITILEGYGLTETSPTLTVNRHSGEGALVGSVGPAIDCVELKIDRSEGDYREGEGEILAHGPNVMIGYYKKPEKTAEVFKEIDGVSFFRTGDIGKFVKGPLGLDYLKITDRKKELLKTSGGKYVAPAPIETKFKEDFLIEQMMVIGDKKKFVSALIIPAEEAVKEWCKTNDVSYDSHSQAIKDPKVIQRFQECCNKYNPEFSHVEQIKKFALLDCQWESVKGDGSDSELTPTMKLKRRVIREKHKADIDNIYGDS